LSISKEVNQQNSEDLKIQCLPGNRGQWLYCGPSLPYSEHMLFFHKKHFLNPKQNQNQKR
jgi:hypothetical protein